MNTFLSAFDNAYYILGRALLGIYFLLPGVLKVIDYSGTLSLMQTQGVPWAEGLLPLTIVIQIGFGVLLIFGKQVRLSALILFGLTLLINFYIHSFWAMHGEPGYGHELQNFIKNLGIAAGLLVLAGRPQ